MKIALITNDFLPSMGGITNVMINVSNRLKELGDAVYVFNKTYHNEKKNYFKVLSNAISINEGLKLNVKFIVSLLSLFIVILTSCKKTSYIKRMELAFFYCFYPKMIVRRIVSVQNLIYEFKNHSFDIILSGTAGTSLLYSYIISKLFNLPIVSIAHGDDFLIRYPFSLKEEMFRNLNSIIVTNRIMKNLFLKIYDINPNKVNIIHLGVNIDQEVNRTKKELRNDLGISEEDFVLLSVSRFYPRKGFDTILKSIKLVLQENSIIPIKYFIIGGGEEEDKIRSLIKKLDLQENVRIIGSIEDKLKNKYYKLSDVFVLVPNVNKNSVEGFGIVYIEANFFNLPVIGSRSGGVRIAIEENKSGLLIEPGDELDLKEKILKLFKEKDFRAKLGNYGRQRVLNNFNWKTNAEKYHALLYSVIKNS